MSNPVAAPAARRWSDLMPRIASALVMAGLALGTAILGGRLFDLFWLVAALAILWEWQHLIGAEGAGMRFGVGAVALTLLVLLAGTGHIAFAVYAVEGGLVAVALAASGALRGTAATGFLYAAGLAFAVLLLRHGSADGTRAILWLFAVVWGTDVMAYFGGRLIGGPKLWPRLSPGKTWSGFLVGIGAGACLGLAAAPAGSSKLALLLVGLAAGAVAQGGDLFESGFKRRYGVKDSGRLIPGHGGAMDRLDGFLAAAVFAALLGVARTGVDTAGLGLLTW